MNWKNVKIQIISLCFWLIIGVCFVIGAITISNNGLSTICALIGCWILHDLEIVSRIKTIHECSKILKKDV